MRLAELQAHFSRAILERNEHALHSLLAPSEISPKEQISIYRVNVTETLIAALRDTYPALLALVGEKFFHQMAYNFVTKNPPSTACLLWYGEDVASFIQAYALAETVPYLADVARLEWALNKARFAEEDAPLDAQWLASQQEETLAHLPLRLRVSVSLIDTPYPLQAIHAFALNPESEPQPQPGEDDAERLVVWRNAGEIKTLLLTPCQYGLLAAFAQGGVLGDAIEAVSQQHPEFDPAEALGWAFALHILAQPSTMTTNAGQPEEGKDENGL